MGKDSVQLKSIEAEEPTESDGNGGNKIEKGGKLEREGEREELSSVNMFVPLQCSAAIYVTTPHTPSFSTNFKHTTNNNTDSEAIF